MYRSTFRLFVTLCFASLFLLGTSNSGRAESQADGRPTPQIAQSWDEAYQLGNWPEAIRLGKALCEREPENSGFVYNLACSYARTGDIESASRTLTESIDLGFENAMLLLSDPDLASLRDHEQFDAIVEKAQANRVQSKAKFQALADVQVPIIWAPEGLDPTEPAPVIIALHPYDNRAEWIVDYWKSTAEKRGAILLAPRAVRPVGDGFQWGAIDETLYLVGTSFELVKEKYVLDESRILLTGFSQGAYMALNLGRLHGNVVTSVLSVAGRYERELGDPELVPKDQRARFYLIAGTEDSAYDSNLLAKEDFEVAGFDVRLREIPGLGHSFPENYEQEIETALDFLWK